MKLRICGIRRTQSRPAGPGAQRECVPWPEPQGGAQTDESAGDDAWAWPRRTAGAWIWTGRTGVSRGISREGTGICAVLGVRWMEK